MAPPHRHRSPAAQQLPLLLLAPPLLACAAAPPPRLAGTKSRPSGSCQAPPITRAAAQVCAVKPAAPVGAGSLPPGCRWRRNGARETPLAPNMRGVLATLGASARRATASSRSRRPPARVVVGCRRAVALLRAAQQPPTARWTRWGERSARRGGDSWGSSEGPRARGLPGQGRQHGKSRAGWRGGRGRAAVGSHRVVHVRCAQGELAWLVQAVNPEVPLGEAALGLIVEEVRERRGGGEGQTTLPGGANHASTSACPRPHPARRLPLCSSGRPTQLTASPAG